MDFDSKLNELQKIAIQMDNENLSINDGIELYKQGVELAKQCYEELNNIKGKVTVIKQDLDKYKEELLD